jgi:hypothetical protein
MTYKLNGNLFFSLVKYDIVSVFELKMKIKIKVGKIINVFFIYVVYFILEVYL